MKITSLNTERTGENKSPSISLWNSVLWHDGGGGEEDNGSGDDLVMLIIISRE